MGYLLYFQDLLISGNVDEVLSRRALHQLKWCEVKEDVITGKKKFLWKKECQKHTSHAQFLLAGQSPHNSFLVTLRSVS